MNRWLIGLALVLSNCAPLHAVMVDSNGLGQALIFPYYTVNAGHQTLISVVNHGDTATAVKLRFREGDKGRQAFALNLYLGRYDVWTAALFATDASSAALLVTDDNSCTVPAIKTSSSLPQLPGGRRYVAFSNAEFSGTRADRGSGEPRRTREGLVELIEMGSVLADSETERAANRIDASPSACQALQQAWNTGGYWQLNPQTDLGPPRGQLSGTISLINVSDGTLFTQQATALSHFSVVVQHTDPDFRLPDLSSAVTETARQKVESTVISAGSVLRSYWPQTRAIDAVSAVLMRQELTNEFNVEHAIGAQSEWLLTFPTKYYHVDSDAPPGSFPPFPRPEPAVDGFGNACLRDQEFRIRAINREQAAPVLSGSITGPQAELCHVTQLLPFNSLSSMFGSRWTESIVTVFNGAAFESGYARIGFYEMLTATRPALGGEQYSGLPVIGFWAQKFLNNDARPGQLGIYSGAMPHNGSVVCRQFDHNCPSR